MKDETESTAKCSKYQADTFKSEGDFLPLFHPMEERVEERRGFLN
jgi:hypothetical protein